MFYSYSVTATTSSYVLDTAVGIAAIGFNYSELDLNGLHWIGIILPAGH